MSSENGLPSITNGMIWSARPISINACASLHTQGLLALRGEQITISHSELQRA